MSDFTLLTTVVLAREDRSLNTLDREERSNLFRLRAIVDDDDDDDRKSTGSSLSSPSDAFFVNSFYPVALVTIPFRLSSSRARPCASREFSRLLATTRNPRVSRTIDRLTAAAECVAGVGGRVRIRSGQPSAAEVYRAQATY